jgi:hypothetical protein
MDSKITPGLIAGYNNADDFNRRSKPDFTV